MFSRRMIGVSVAQGVCVLAAVLGIYVWSAWSGLGAAGGVADQTVRTLAFVTLVTGNLGLIFVNRSWTHTVLGGLRIRNSALWWVAGGTVGVLVTLLSFAPTRDLFGFTVVSLAEMSAAIGIGIASVAWFEVYKMIVRARREHVA
jgi:Ca2+-transporting ATPase